MLKATSFFRFWKTYIEATTIFCGENQLEAILLRFFKNSPWARTKNQWNFFWATTISYVENVILCLQKEK